MHYLYGSKPGEKIKLVATFESEPQLLAYTRWATLKTNSDGAGKFEQGSALAGGYVHWDHSPSPLTDDDPRDVIHNPTPNML
jgi:hypothetical protein